MTAAGSASRPSPADGSGQEVAEFSAASGHIVRVLGRRYLAAAAGRDHGRGGVGQALLPLMVIWVKG